MKDLYQKLEEYSRSAAYPFHMPGHKRNGEGNPLSGADLFSIDLTEIDGFDNLHHAEGILKEAQERAAKLYGSSETHYLVNGSTCGILSAIAACTGKGGRILMARNCHKAAYHGALLGELKVSYLYPAKEWQYGINGGILAEDVARALQDEPDIQAVIITSPTFDGVVSDIRAIADKVHEYGILLIVDEAHGAHFGLHAGFPQNSVRLGADIVIHSLHKTLPSFTQTALLHVNGSQVNRDRLRMYLGIYQTSSPSYVLMVGMDICARMIQDKGDGLFSLFVRRLENFAEHAAEWKHIRLAGSELTGSSGIFDFDRSKLILDVTNTPIVGNELQQRLRKVYHLELEMAAGNYALALTSVMDTDEGFVRLIEAIREIDAELTGGGGYKMTDQVTRNKAVCRISEAMESKMEAVCIEQSAGRISGEFLYLYPPGIPLLVPGEQIEKELVDQIRELKAHGYALQGLRDFQIKKIQVLCGEYRIGRV